MLSREAPARSIRSRGSNTIVVVPDTPAKNGANTRKKPSAPFYIQNTDLKETMDALRVVSDIRSISPLTGINALVVRDTPERLQVAGRFLSAFDKARPELVVDVEILEVDRTRLHGIRACSSPRRPRSPARAIDRASSRRHRRDELDGAKASGASAAGQHPALGCARALLPPAQDDTTRGHSQTRTCGCRTASRPRPSLASGSRRRMPRLPPSPPAASTGADHAIHVSEHRREHLDHPARARQRRSDARR